MSLHELIKLAWRATPKSKVVRVYRKPGYLHGLPDEELERLYNVYDKALQAVSNPMGSLPSSLKAELNKAQKKYKNLRDILAVAQIDRHPSRREDLPVDVSQLPPDRRAAYELGMKLREFHDELFELRTDYRNAQRALNMEKTRRQELREAKAMAKDLAQRTSRLRQLADTAARAAYVDQLLREGQQAAPASTAIVPVRPAPIEVAARTKERDVPPKAKVIARAIDKAMERARDITLVDDSATRPPAELAPVRSAPFEATAGPAAVPVSRAGTPVATAVPVADNAAGREAAVLQTLARGKRKMQQLAEVAERAAYVDQLVRSELPAQTQTPPAMPAASKSWTKSPWFRYGVPAAAGAAGIGALAWYLSQKKKRKGSRKLPPEYDQYGG